jgi:NAD(P)-dependent dehydrogenase (short-subunit alcohol dehydrogenase family)
MARKNLRRKVIVVTGASSGFGKGAALEFAAAGASVVLAARREDALVQVASACQARGGRALVVPTDVSEQAEVERLVDTTVRELGRIDVWVNNAGVGALGRFDVVPIEMHRQVIETNLLGAMYGSYFALRQFRSQGYGTLINISSVLGKVPAPCYSSYAASKHGIVGMDGVIRQELALDKLDRIHVCTVLPTTMDTPYFDHAANYIGHETRPIPPVYDPEKVVETIVSLATKPEDEVVVGLAGKVMTAVRAVAPGVADTFMRELSHRVQVEQAPPMPPTSGNVAEPMLDGTDVDGGRMAS